MHHNLAEFYQEIFSFPVLHRDWELDTTAWVIEFENGDRALKMTSHGSAYIADVSELQEKIAEYDNALRQTALAIDMLWRRNE